MKVSINYWRSIIVVVLVACVLVVPATMPAAVSAGNPNPRVLPPNSHPHGLTYAQWSAKWWQWALAVPAPVNPILDATGANCAQGQSGSVWFLAGTSGGAVTRSCTIPAGKSIMFPIVNVENDYPCPDPNFHPAPGQSLEDFLTQGAKAIIDPVNELEVEVDGVSLRNLFDYRATSKLFMFTGDPSLTAAFDSCITGSSQPAVSDGYWIMLAPLPVGTHTIHFRGGVVGSFEIEVTYNLTVTAHKP
jgi:hypothetical protein